MSETTTEPKGVRVYTAAGKWIDYPSATGFDHDGETGVLTLDRAVGHGRQVIAVFARGCWAAAEFTEEAAK